MNAKLTKKEKQMLELTMRDISDELARAVRELGLGAVMVRAYVDGSGNVIMRGKAHDRVYGMMLPEEIVGFTEVDRK